MAKCSTAIQSSDIVNLYLVGRLGSDECKRASSRDALSAVRVGMSRVAGESGRSTRRNERERASGRNAPSAVGVGVCWIASESGGGRGSDEGECSVGRDALSAVRVRVRRVASKGCGGCRCHQAQGTGGRDAGGSVGVRVSRVASKVVLHRVGRCEACHGNDRVQELAHLEFVFVFSVFAFLLVGDWGKSSKGAV